MRYCLFFLFIVNSAQLFAAPEWHGFCIIEKDNQHICSEPQPRYGDFSPVCNAFARQEGVSYWQAQFFTDLNQLQRSLPDYCDEVRDGTLGGFYACQVTTYCPQDSVPFTRHLASKVYAIDQKQAVEFCFEKEERHYVREFKEQSLNGCFAAIAVEQMQ